MVAIICAWKQNRSLWLGLLIRTNNKGREGCYRSEKWKMKSNSKKEWLAFFYNCVTTGRRGVGFEKLPYTFRKDFGGAVKWGKEHFWNIYNLMINAKYVSLFPLRNAQRWSSSFFPQSHSIPCRPPREQGSTVVRRVNAKVFVILCNYCYKRSRKLKVHTWS